MTAIITRLKISVDNKNLPVITADGQLLNYFVGKYVNALDNLGVNLTTNEFNAVNTLIENAISHGWVDYVDYFFPFIGSKIRPSSGFVPLIDRYSNYDISRFEIGRSIGGSGLDNEDTFAYDNSDRITSFGYISSETPIVRRGTGVVIKDVTYNNNKNCIFVAVQSVLEPYRDANYYLFVNSDKLYVTKGGRTNESGASNHWDKMTRTYRTSLTGSTRSIEVPTDQLTIGERYLSYYIGKDGTNYVRTIMEANGSTIRNYKGTDGSNVFDYSCYPAMGNDYNGGTSQSHDYRIETSRNQVYALAYLNDLANTSISTAMSEDVRQFEISLGRCVVSV